MRFLGFCVLLVVGALSQPLDAKPRHRSILPQKSDTTFEWRIRAGTPRIFHDIAISTASVNTFLAAPDFDRGTKDLRPYQPERSSTGRQVNGQYRITEKAVALFGTTHQDILQFKNLNITHQFGLVNSMTGQERMGVDGQFGLAWVPYERVGKPSASTPIIHSLLADQKEKVYHVYAAPGPKRIKLGGESFCGDETPLFHPILKDKPIPMITVTDFELGDYHSAVDYPALIDSSSPVLRFPRAIYSAIIKEFDAYYDSNLDALLVECNGKYHHWKITINKKTTLTLTDDQMITGISSSDKCALMVDMYDDEVETYTLGLPVLYDYCMTFDVGKNRIAFVKSPEDVPPN